jgi:hypothetical protein
MELSPACHSEAWRRIQQDYRMRVRHWILHFVQNDKQRVHQNKQREESSLASVRLGGFGIPAGFLVSLRMTIGV